MPLISHILSKHVHQEVQIIELCYHYNIELQPHGRNFYGYCPFHEDSSLSLVINPRKNSWKCTKSCCRGGDNIRFVMKLENISHQQAVEKIRFFTENKHSNK